MMGEHTETTSLSLQELRDAGPTVTDLGPLHVCDNHVAWSLSKTLTVKAGPLPGAYLILLISSDPRLPDPPQSKGGNSFFLRPCFVKAYGKPVPF